MQIIFVSNALANGGAARVLCLLANHFFEKQHDVTVLSFTPYPDEFPLHPGVEVIYGPSGHGSGAKFRRLRWLRGIIRANPHARIIAFEYFVNLSVLLACIGMPNRIVVSERNDPARVGNGFPNGILRRVLYRKAHLVVCQTDEAAAYFSHRIRKKVILNPINPSLPSPVDSGRRNAIVAFCRLEPQKNLEMLIRAFASFHANHPAFVLEIYGNGAEHGYLSALIERLKLSNSASVLPARSDIHEVVRECAMFVLPSDYEGLSNSMLEAMALGVPSICTDCPCGGARTVIEDGENGLLVPVGDVNALVDAMTRVANDAELAYALGKNARKLRSELTLDRIAREWLVAIDD